MQFAPTQALTGQVMDQARVAIDFDRNGNAEKHRRAHVLLGATLGHMTGVTPAIHAAFGLLLIPLSQEFGWSRTSLSAGLGLLSFICMVGYPLIGRYADQRGPWHIVTFGTVMFGLALASGFVLTGSIWHFYLLYTALAIGGILVNPTLYLKMLSETHSRDFGFAAGFSGGVGVGVGYALMTIVCSIVLTHFGWRYTYLAVAAFVVIVGLTAQLALLRSVGRHQATTPGLKAPVTDERSSYILRADFWFILLGLALMGGLMMGVMGHIIPILAGNDVPTAKAAQAVAICNVIILPWQPICGMLIDRYGPRAIVLPYLMTAVGLVLLLIADDWLLILPACMLFGIGVGTQFCAIPFMVQRRFGLKSFSGVMGVLYIGLFAGQGIGPIALDMIYDKCGSYVPAIIGAAVLTIVGAAMTWLLASRPAGGANV
jgi:MFS family permease